MHYLSENNIKTVTLRFLKTYYKFRPRSGETSINRDLKSADGIIADGQLVFPINKDDQFTATFEATSYETKGEVYYQLQKKLLFSDALAVSFLICAFFFSWGYAYGYITIEQLGLTRYFSALAVLFLACYWIYNRLCYSMHKYRYIYAIEQFKRYHADEQWISIGTDVFKSPADPSFIELRDQCVYNGFGLIIVNLDLEPQLLITPSREELFGKQRSRKQFNSKKKAGKSKNDFSSRLRERLSAPLGNAYSLLRYQQTNYMQWLLSCVSLGILATLGYLQLRDDSLVYADEQKYEQSMFQQSKKSLPETKAFRMDTVSMKNYEDLDVPYISEEESLDDPTPMETSKGASGEILVASGEEDVMTHYDCERFYNINQKVYIVQEQAYKSMEEVHKRIKRLTAVGLEANALWLGCFSRTNQDYVVYLDMMYESKEEAQSYATKYKKILRAKGLRSSKLVIRSINRAK